MNNLICFAVFSLMFNMANADLPGEHTYFMFLVQKADSSHFQQLKNFTRSYSKAHEGSVDPELAKDTLHFAVVCYDGAVTVPIDFENGHTLDDVPAFSAAVADIPYNLAMPGSDLTGAILEAHRVFEAEATAGYLQMLVVITDGQADGDPGKFAEAVDLIHEDNRAVQVIGWGDNLNLKNLKQLAQSSHLQTRAIDGSSQEDLLLVAPSESPESVVQETLKGISSFFDFACNKTMTTCSVSCGIGKRSLHEYCEAYNRGGTVIDSWNSHYIKVCCIQPCPVSGSGKGGLHKPITCNKFGPANGRG